MQTTQSIWGTNKQSSKLPSEYSLKQFIGFYAWRVQVFLLTLFFSIAMSGIFILANRFPLAFIIGLVLILSVATLTLFSGYKYLRHAISRLRPAMADLHSPKLVKDDVPEEQIIEEIYVLRLSGKLVADNCNELSERINQLLEKGHRRILIDLNNIDYMDAAGIGTLVSCFTKINKEGGQMKLSNLTPSLQSLLKFETYHDEETALEAFKSISKS